MVGRWSRTGVVNDLARAATQLTGGNINQYRVPNPRRLTSISKNYRQHSYVATMTPLVAELVAVMGGQLQHRHPLVGSGGVPTSAAA